MYTHTEGIILRQTKTLHSRRMIVLFSERYGKISAGTYISERGKSKSSLALRPFTLGRYELYKNRDSYNINASETVESFFSIGEDVEKFMAASYALELTNRLLPEDEPAAGIFNLLKEFLKLLEHRKDDYDALLICYMLKALQMSGNGPQLKMCCRCGRQDNLKHFSIHDGGLLCSACPADEEKLNTLIFELSDDIINVVRFMESHPIRSMWPLALPKDTEHCLKGILRSWYAYHLGIDNLKSEGLKI